MVTATTADPSATNNTDTAGATGNSSADLKQTKTDLPDPVTAGNNLTYTLSVENFRPSRSSTLWVTHALPSGTPLVSATGTGWTCTGTTTVTCTRASLGVTTA